jgi:hypothetical protein
MSAHHTPTLPEVQANIDIVAAVLRTCQPGHQDIPLYQNMLNDLHTELANVRQAESSTIGATFSRLQPQHAAPPSRKRSLGLTSEGDGPDPKRLSANPSPQTPSTPDSFDTPVYTPLPQQQQQQALIARQNQHQQQPQWALPSRASPTVQISSTPVYDLTESNPPSPDRSVAFEDPFAELENAFRDDGARPVPADAFTQEAMGQEELAQFLITPTPANGGYAFQQQRQEAAVAAPAKPLGFARDVPYLPGPEVPAWMGRAESEEEDYGAFPLNVSEADAIEKMLETIQDDSGGDDREQTPVIMKSKLKEYQKIGLKWLLKMENSRHKGGILADEMGLGKTVQALALICARPSQDLRVKTTLIIAPVALMRQWQSEISNHVKDLHQLSVYLYHGNGKKADFDKLRTYDVVLTTFGTLTSEFKQKDSRRETMLYERELNEPNFRRKSKDKLALLGRECMWYRIIIDEAHMIKNRNSIQSKASVDLQARHRLCLSGTPMMNSIDELYPLLRFLQIDRYNDWKMFSMDIARVCKSRA